MSNPSRKIIIAFWFLTIASLVYFHDLWLAQNFIIRSISVTLVMLISFGALIRERLFDLRASFDSTPTKEKGLSASEQSALSRILDQANSTRRAVGLGLLLLLAYLFATVSACGKISTVNELYLYLAGWAVLCLVLDSQIRIYVLGRIIKKLLSRS